MKFSIYLIIGLFFFDILSVTALLIGTEKLAALLYHIAAALRAFLSGRFLPGHEITFRIILTAVITSALFRLFDHNILAALRTGHSGLFQIWLGILAVRESRAGKEFAMGAILDYHVASADIADHTRNFIGDFHRLQSLLRSGYRLIQIRIEVLDDRFTVPSATLSKRSSMFAVKLKSTILGKHFFIMPLTASPNSVMYRFLFSLVT